MNLRQFIDENVLEQISEIVSRKDLSNEQKINIIKFVIEC